MFGIFKKQEEFKIGDLVICIDDCPFGAGVQPPVKFKHIYKILDITTTSCCKTKVFDIGLRAKNFTQCAQHNKVIPGNGIHWAGALRFRKATPEEAQAFYEGKQEEIKSLIKEAVEKEDYETAKELQELIE